MNSASKLQVGLTILRGVLEGELAHVEVCRIPNPVPRLTVAHAVMHALPEVFFHPNTTRLLGHYNKALALLVGETPRWSSDIVQASYKLCWHKPLEGMHGRAEGSIQLSTPPEILALLKNHIAAEYAVNEFYNQAVKRDAGYRL